MPVPTSVACEDRNVPDRHTVCLTTTRHVPDSTTICLRPHDGERKQTLPVPTPRGCTTICWTLPVITAIACEHHNTPVSTSNTQPGEKIYQNRKTIIWNDLPTTKPTGWSLSDIRISMLATCAGAHHGNVSDTSSSGVRACWQHLKANIT